MMKFPIFVIQRYMLNTLILVALVLGSLPYAAVAAPAPDVLVDKAADTAAPTQDDPTSPANLQGRTVGSAEIALLWSEPLESPNPLWHSSHKLYSYLRTQDSEVGLIRHPDEKCPLVEDPAADCTVNPGEHDGVIQSPTGDIWGDRALDMIAADLNGDGLDDLVSAWEGPDRTITLAVPQEIDENLDWTTAVTLTTAAGILPDTNFEAVQMHLAAGNFDGDGESEFVLAYRGNDEVLHLEVYDTDGTLTPQQRATEADLGSDAPRLPATLTNDVEEYALAAGDVDGDGMDEVILVSAEPYTPTVGAEDQGKWGLYAAVYDVEGEGSATLRQKARLHTFPTTFGPGSVPSERENNSGVGGIGVVTGDFDGDEIDEIAYGFGIIRLHDFPYDRSYLQMLQLNEDGTLTAGDFEEYGSHVGNIQIAAGDIDGDVTRDAACSLTLDANGAPIENANPLGKLRDEVAFAAGDNQLKIYCIATDLKAVNISFASGGDYIELADIDEDGRDELISATNIEFSSSNTVRQQMSIKVSKGAVDLSGRLLSLNLLAERRDLPTTLSQSRTLVLAMGDFDGTSYRFGEPTRYRQTEVVQPIVVLNAPPIHFDVLNDTTYDIGTCYGAAECAFRATYTKESQNTSIGTTTLNSSWSVERGLNLDLGVAGISILKGSMKESFGESFSKSGQTGQTLNIVMTDTASRDDRIFAVVVDYDIWEYPIFRGDPDTPVGYMVIVQPSRADNRWFASKSPDGNTYRPIHEVGNLFSYPNYQSPSENPDRASGVIWDQQSASFQVGPDSTAGEKWKLTFEKFGQIENKTSHNSSFTLSGSAGLFFLNGDIEETESEELVSTYTTQVNESIEIAIELGKTVVSPAGTFYTISPYVYWAKNGALVVDYLVNPAKDNQGGSTWWQREYDTLPDPAFVLPWRYDPEKAGQEIEGFSDIQRLRSKDITISPARPQPGDTVQLQAHIHNYSFKPTSSANVQVPVKVRFYLGDPAHGGEMIAEGMTNGNLGEREKATVTGQWTIPADADWRYARIYAVIDPDNEITEIHESNNKGWAILGFVCAVCTSPPDLSITPGSVQIFRQSGQIFRVKAQIEAAGAGSAGVPVEFYSGNPAQQGRKIGESVIAKIERKGKYLIDEVVNLANAIGGDVIASASAQDEIWIQIAAEGPEDSNSTNNALGGPITDNPDPGPSPTNAIYLPLLQRQ